MPDMITVRVRAFAGLREALGFAVTEMRVPAGSDVARLLSDLDSAYPRARLAEARYGIAVNRGHAHPERVLAQGDEVALIPPVSGGMPVSGETARLFEITDHPLSLDDVASRVTAPERGGVTLFAGTVRGVTRPAGGQGTEIATDYLEYEAYPEMAEGVFAQIAAEVAARWPEVSRVSIVHRIGRLAVGDLAVIVAVAAAHRQATFDACHYAIDRVKQIAPIWKKEVGPDGSFWVEGPESAVTG